MRVATFQNQTLYQADFLWQWQKVEPASIDLVLADPPYGALTSAQPWDRRPDFHVITWIFRQLLKPTGQIVIFADFHTAIEIQSAFERYHDYRFSWYWQKPSLIPQNHTKPANDVELILVYKRKRAKIEEVTFNLDALRTTGDPFNRQAGKGQNRNPTRKGGGSMPDLFINNTGDRYPRSILRYPNKPCMPVAERTSHPTQKPIGLLGHILKGLTNPGDIVLDPFAGSGSTLVACHNLGRVGIGYELCEEYFQMAKTRLEHHTLQEVLI